MSEQSRIEWTDSTWNPVTGCTKVSPGCKHCYAQVFSERFRGVPGHPYEHGFDLYLWPNRLELPLSWKAPRRIFVNSMSDLFHERVPDTFIDAVFDTMKKASWHQFQVLTKRAERMAHYVQSRYSWDSLGALYPNIWLGVSVETQDYVSRVDILCRQPSAVRFLSCEPLLGCLDLTLFLRSGRIDWVIVGGESGFGARPVDPEWIVGLRDQCIGFGVPFFFKQWGGVNKKAAGRLLLGRTWDEMPTQRGRMSPATNTATQGTR